MDISWDNQKCPKNGGIITLRRYWPSADLNEIFSAEKWLKHKYSRFETRTFGYSLDSSILNEIFSAEKWLKLKYTRFETRTFGFY
jgi:hypothetical protein